MKKTVGSILAVCLLASATAAFGGVKAGSFSVTPVIGGYDYVDDPSDNIALVIGARAGYNFTGSFGIEAVYDYITEENDLAGSPFSAHRFGGQALYHFFPDSVFVPYLAAGYSSMNFEDTAFDNKNHGAVDYGVGAKFFLTDDIALRGDVRHIFYRYNSGSINNYEFTLGAYFQYGAPERVARAISPALAPTPIKAEIVHDPVPATTADSDNDGVIDSLDKCSATTSGIAVDSDGCPLDNDKDGVPDTLDKCPDTPTGVGVDGYGCPLPG